LRETSSRRMRILREGLLSGMSYPFSRVKMLKVG